MFEVVTLVAPYVRPWNPPRKAMIPGRPVTRRASLSAPSIASEPELRNMTESSGAGKVAARARGQLADRRGEADRVDRADQPVDLGVDGRGDPRMRMPERRDRDAVGEVQVRPPVRVVQAMPFAVTPVAHEVAAEDGGQVRGGLHRGRVPRRVLAAPDAPARPGPAAYDAAMVDFTLTDENRLVQGSVRDFAEAEILPYIREWDEKGEVHREVFARMGELGFLGAPIPEAYGGAGMDYLSFAILCEELERADTSFRVVQSVHVGLNSLALLQWGTEEQRQRWLVPQARGEKLATFGLTEPGVGTDAANLQTTARRDGDVYRLNGQKIWISLADIADHFLVFASVDRAKKHKGVTAFMLERGMAGLTTGTLHGKLGIRAGNTGLINLDDVPVPVENRIGEEGEGFLIAMSAIDQGRFTVAAGAVGLAQACLDASVRYAHERHTFGQEIGEHQLVKQLIAKMAAGTEMGRLLVWRAGWLKNQGLRNTRETSLAKWHATEHAVQSALDAIQVHGANGYSNEFPVERYLRNSKAAVIYEGTSQLHTLIQADYALGLSRGSTAPLRAMAGPGLGTPGLIRASAEVRAVSDQRVGATLAAGTGVTGSCATGVVPSSACGRTAGMRLRAVTVIATDVTMIAPATIVRRSIGSLRMIAPRITATTGLT